MSGTKNACGFRVYAEFEDTYGANVMVMESSADPLDKMWIFVKGGTLSSNDSAAHLDADMARQIRDAINEWLKDQAAMGPVREDKP